MHGNKAYILSSAPGDHLVSLRLSGPRAEYETSLRSDGIIHRFDRLFLRFIDFIDVTFKITWTPCLNNK